MIKILIRSRFQAFFAAMVRSDRKRKQNPFMKLLIGAALLYAAGAIEFILYQMFDSFSVFFDLGIGWLYYAVGGVMALGLAVIGSVFMTQNQLFHAKDNELLLSMPIPPSAILLSRMIVLVVLNLFCVLLVMIPAGAVSILTNGFSAQRLMGFLVSVTGVTLVAQTLACAFGWLLHQLLSRIANKAAASLIYMILFFVVYFGAYSQASRMMNTMITNGSEIAGFVRKSVWPLFVLGTSFLGKLPELAGFISAAVLLFAAVCALLSKNLTKTLTVKSTGKRRIYRIGSMAVRSPGRAIRQKELRRFLTSSVYLTNQGLGLLMMPAAAIAAFVFQGYLEQLLSMFGSYLTEGMAAGAILVCIGFLLSTACISAPSVSLEGNWLWILRSMPVTGKEILCAKLLFHMELSVPVAAVSGLAAGIAFHCTVLELLLIFAGGAALAVLCGLTGLIFNLMFPNFDWLNEAGPCKRSAAVMLTMLVMITYTIGPAALYLIVCSGSVSCLVFVAGYTAITVLINIGLYWVLIGWGSRVLENLDV